MLQYYNSETKTLTFPYDFVDQLVDLPEDTKIIIFEPQKPCKFSRFNQPVDYLPNEN